MKTRMIAIGLLVLAGCTEPELVSETDAPVAPAAVDEPAAELAPDVSSLPAGAYRIDPSHASLVFSVDHLGFSNYTAQFRTFTADLQLDPSNPAAAQLTARIDPASLDLPSPPAGFLQEMIGPNWLDATAFPEMIYTSTAITMTGPATATITGDFTFRGMTKPVELEARFNGGWPGIIPDPHARLGFSATGVLQRSEFGLDVGVPTPPSKMGVGDEVSFSIEAEFIGPAWNPQVPPGTVPAEPAQ